VLVASGFTGLPPGVVLFPKIYKEQINLDQYYTHVQYFDYLSLLLKKRINQI
jgi:hypothetical protein